MNVMPSPLNWVGSILADNSQVPLSGVNNGGVTEGGFKWSGGLASCPTG